MIQAPTFSIGIEEEFFLVDGQTGDLACDPPRALLADCERELDDRVSCEYLRSQVETNTGVCHTLVQARGELAHLRTVVAVNAQRHGLFPIASATHPFARWSDQKTTDQPRYRAVARELQSLGSRMAICGLHVHVGIDDDDLRIELMNGLRCFLPHLLALSTSSPFWQGRRTGLKSFRTTVNDATPRKGVPEQFASWADYKDAVDLLVDNGVIEDATKIWWDLRPSDRFPTLELRITDACPLIEDSVCIAALFRCLCRCLYRRRHVARRRDEPLLLINENRWRAARFGIDQGLIEHQSGLIFALPEAIDRLLGLIADDARHFGCVAEVEHARTIVRRGTSADRQLELFDLLMRRGRPRSAALKQVVDLLIAETLSGTGASFASFPGFLEVAAFAD